MLKTILDEVRALSPGLKDLRSFGLTVGGAFVVLWAVLAFVLPALFDKGGNYPALAAIGLVLIVLGLAAPAVLRPVYYAWMTLALTLGYVMTRVILTIFYFVVITPVGLFFRLVGRDALARRFERDAKTYWIEKEYPITDRSRYEKFF